MSEFIPKNILVIKFRNIGDVLLTAPLISTLKLEVPGSRVCAAVKQGTEEMLEGHPHLDKLYVLPKRSENEWRIIFFLRKIKWILQLRAERFDLSINTTDGDRGILLGYAIGAKQRWSQLSPKGSKRWQKKLVTKLVALPKVTRHTILDNLEFAKLLTDKLHFSVILNFKEEDKEIVKKELEHSGYKSSIPLVHIHPTSRWLFKACPTQTMGYIIDQLYLSGYQVVITCSNDPKELLFTQDIISNCKSTPINLGGRLTLKQIAAISIYSCQFFGVDSAPMHIAASQGTPCMAIFGPSGAFKWGPWPNGIKECSDSPYPNKNGVQDFIPHEVIQKTWGCIPCGKDGCEGTKRSACIDTLDRKQLASALIKQLESRTL